MSIRLGHRWTNKPPWGVPRLDRSHPAAIGLVAWWLFNEGTGPLIGDLAGRYHGVYSGTAAPTWNGGPRGGVMTFASASFQYVPCGDIKELNGASQFTIVAWMRRNATSNACIISKTDGTANNRLGINFFTDGITYLNLGNGSNTYGQISGINDTAWHRCVVAFDGTQATNATRLKLYVDGTARTLTYVGTIPATTASMSGPFEIGRMNTGSLFYSNGHVDDVRVYSRPWAAEDVTRDLADPFAAILAPAARRFVAVAAAGGGPTRWQLVDGGIGGNSLVGGGLVA